MGPNTLQVYIVGILKSRMHEFYQEIGTTSIRSERYAGKTRANAGMDVEINPASRIATLLSAYCVGTQSICVLAVRELKK